MELTRHSLTTADGRHLEYGTVGNPSGKTVVFHHGTPGCLLTFMRYQELVALGDFFVIAYSRAGYGESSRNEGRSIGDVVADVKAIVEKEGRSTYVSVGWSGGGPHALACAALDPKCTGVLSVAGVAPIDADFDWTEGMGQANIDEFELAKIGGPEYEAHARAAVASFKDVTVENVISLFGDLMSEEDKSAWEPLYLRERASQDFRHAFSKSSDGFIDDDRAFLKPWGFAVTDITVPTSIWYGSNDLMVPSSHGDWLTKSIPAAVGHYFAQDGHMSIWLKHLEEIAADIAAK
jgi:pimeloyl-ACP methyl ester carboxylesterase